MRTKTHDGGTVKRVSVAVVVDGDTTDTSGKDVYRPRSPQELKQIETLVKSAMGFDASRGDQVQVVNMAFARVDTGPSTAEAQHLLGLDSSDWFKIIEAGILCLTALLMGLFVGRPLIHRMFAPMRAQPSGRARAAARRAAHRARRRPVSRRCTIGRARRAARTRRPGQHDRHPAASKDRCANPPSVKSAKSSRRIPKKRWRSCAPGFINRLGHDARNQRQPRTISASSPAPNAWPS